MSPPCRAIPFGIPGQGGKGIRLFGMVHDAMPGRGKSGLHGMRNGLYLHPAPLLLPRFPNIDSLLQV